MATRTETQNKRAALARDLRLAQREGRLRAGDAVPPQRELAERFGLSMNVVGQEIGKLIKEGVFHAIPRVGTFVGPPRGAARSPESGARELYVLLANTEGNWAPLNQIRLGFEDRVASRGGAVLTLSCERARQWRDNGDWRRAVGAFELSESFGAPPGELARVVYGAHNAARAGADTLSFDDFDGGALATRHLRGSGARHIAFAGLHAAQEAADSWLSWSAERARGWRAELNQPKPTMFLPRDSADATAPQTVAREFAAFVGKGGVCDGVVAANDGLARDIIEALKSARVAPENWPAIVGFDSDPNLRDQLLTSLRLPWDELGRRAADLLWERHHAPPDAPLQHVAVPMRLIARVSCRGEWSRYAELSAMA